jgi:hypothetical protein
VQEVGGEWQHAITAATAVTAAPTAYVAVVSRSAPGGGIVLAPDGGRPAAAAAAISPVAIAPASVSAAAHASNLRTLRSVKRKASDLLSLQHAANATVRAERKETREKKAKLEQENERLRDELQATKRQHTQSKYYYKGRVRNAAQEAADLRAELAERTTEVGELMCKYEQYKLVMKQTATTTQAGH